MLCTGNKLTKMNKTLAKTFSITFILSFLSYGIGSSLMEVVNTPNATAAYILAQKTEIIIGGLLITFLHTVFNVILLSVMFNTLKRINIYLSGYYLILGLISTLMLSIGGVFLLTSIPISIKFNEIAQYDQEAFLMLINIIRNVNFYFYQIGMAIWGLGGLFFCYLLYVSKLVPANFARCGYAGYGIFISGTILELTGYPWGLIFSIPGGIFELSLCLLFIFKSFNKNL